MGNVLVSSAINKWNFGSGLYPLRLKFYLSDGYTEDGARVDPLGKMAFEI